MDRHLGCFSACVLSKDLLNRAIIYLLAYGLVIYSSRDFMEQQDIGIIQAFS